MKRFLTASVVFNILLSAVVLWLLRSGQAAKKSSPVPALTFNVEPENQSPSPFASKVTSATVKTFHWNQLESTNYQTYIANLRRVGCPEQTVRDIIAADVDAAFFAPRRDQLKQSEPVQAQEYALQELNKEEADFIATLLGGQPVSPQVAVHSSPVRILRAKSQAEREAEQPVSLPLVMQSVDPNALNLTEAQLQNIAELRQTFLDEIGGTNQNPEDPAYRQRWQAAQREADDMLTGMFGRNFTLNYQMQVENLTVQPK